LLTLQKANEYFSGMLFSTSYLPPGHILKKIIETDAVFIEAYEHYKKQTLRNRCHILSPNGVQTLIVPVTQSGLNRTAVKDVRISDDIQWQRQHWRSLTAAYRRSAFFEFYEDELHLFYVKKYVFLLDFNTELLRWILQLLHVKATIQLTETYVQEATQDFRNCSDLRSPANDLPGLTYPQVFEYKGSFTPGLSIIDLLFNTGPQAMAYL
jgi:hypothetical protein